MAVHVTVWEVPHDELCFSKTDHASHAIPCVLAEVALLVVTGNKAA